MHKEEAQRRGKTARLPARSSKKGIKTGRRTVPAHLRHHAETTMCGNGERMETLNALLKADNESAKVIVQFGNHMN